MVFKIPLKHWRINLTVIDLAQSGAMSDDQKSTPTAEATFLATASHEIRTPLNGILGTVSLLLETDLEPAQKEYAETIHQSGVRLLELLNNVLDYARLDSDALEVEAVHFSPAELAREVVELLAPKAHAKGIDIAVRTSGLATGTARTDAGRLRQILFNLIGNALKFTEEGGVLVDVTADEASVRFSVYDSGPGIEQDKQAGLFDAFRQSDTADAYKDGGVGLGLAIARRLAGVLGGEISLRSEPGWGSIFELFLPSRVTQDICSDTSTESTTKAVYLLGLPPATSLAIAAALHRNGCSTRRVESATEIPKAPDTIVLVGADLPHASLKAAIARAPTLVVLRSEDRAALPRFRKLGCSGWLIRPLRVATLLDRIDHALDGGEEALEEAVPADLATSGPSQRVLVADDNPINALIARRALEHAGFSVTVVGTGSEAVESCGSIDYALILMDLRMPVMDGFEAIKRIRALGDETPIIAISAEVNPMIERRARETGANGVAEKPIDAESLRQLAARWTSPSQHRNIA